MGTPMAGQLLEAGHRLFVRSGSSVPRAVLEAGATASGSGREVAQQADIVFTMVPDTPNVDDALFSAEGVASGLSAGKTVVGMNSISPIATKAFAAKINALGCDYLDAPVSGGEVGDSQRVGLPHPEIFAALVSGTELLLEARGFAQPGRDRPGRRGRGAVLRDAARRDAAPGGRDRLLYQLGPHQRERGAPEA